MNLIPIIQTLSVIVIFIAVTAKIDSTIDFMPDWLMFIFVWVFAISFTALPVVLLMHIWGF